jgi:hypothetical protein
MLAEVSQYCKTSLTNPAATPYAVFASAGTAAFLDIVNGNNAVAYSGGTSQAYVAKAGYDNVTGLGVPMGMPFARALCPNRSGSIVARGTAAVGLASGAPTRASTLDVTPKLRGLIDLGRRSAVAQTRIQLVLAPAPSLAASEQAATGVLETAGFTVERTFANHLVVDADAGSAAVERLFGTEMHDVAQGRYGTRYLPVRPIAIPSSLAPYVTGISLDNVVNAASIATP